jgi:hypothetical protein
LAEVASISTTPGEDCFAIWPTLSVVPAATFEAAEVGAATVTAGEEGLLVNATAAAPAPPPAIATAPSDATMRLVFMGMWTFLLIDFSDARVACAPKGERSGT